MAHINTTLATTMLEVDDKVRYDAVCKRILSERRILAEIMKGCLEEFQGITVKEIVEEYMEGTPEISGVSIKKGQFIDSRLDTIGVEDHEGKIGKNIYDIKYTTYAPSHNKRVKLIINVEAQNDNYPGYSLVTRGIFYCGRMLSSQQGSEFIGTDYSNLKKVYSIWICMNPAKKNHNTITTYSISPTHMVGEVEVAKQSYDLLNVIMIRLGGINSKTDIRILRLLNILLTDEITVQEKMQLLEQECHIPMTHELESEVATMCNLSQGIEDRGIAKGIELGREQGRTQGIELGKSQGREQGLLTNLKNIMETMALTVEEAMNALKVPEGEREKYMELL